MVSTIAAVMGAFLSFIALGVAFEKLIRDIIYYTRGEEALREYEERERRMLEEHRAIHVELWPPKVERIERGSTA